MNYQVSKLPLDKTKPFVLELKKSTSMKFLFSIIMSLLINSIVVCQEIKEYQSIIDSLILVEKPKEAISFALEQKRAADFQYYEMVYNQIPFCTNKADRILSLKIVNDLQYYLYQGEIGFKAKDMYYKSTKNLIKELAGDLEELKYVKVIPALRPLLYPRLKEAIELAGGEWTRGEIVEYYLKVPIPRKHTDWSSDTLSIYDPKIIRDSLNRLEKRKN